MNDNCITGLSRYGHCGAAACCPMPYECCAACPEDCNSRCGWLEIDRKDDENDVQGNA